MFSENIPIEATFRDRGCQHRCRTMKASWRYKKPLQTKLIKHGAITVKISLLARGWKGALSVVNVNRLLCHCVVVIC